MPAIPVISSVPSLSAWPLWQRGAISAANVTWSVDASDTNAQQTLLLSNLAVAKGYNAIRLVLSAGSSLHGWVDMGNIATFGWSDESQTLLTTDQTIKQIAANIDAILVKCSMLGMGVILDCHDFFQRDQDDGSVGMLWQGVDAATLRQKLQDFWTVTVQRWGRANWANVWVASGQNLDTLGPWPVIGYELLNEPNPDPTLTFTQMQASEDNNWWALADKCIKAIRKLDASTPIVVDGIYYADAYGLSYFDTVTPLPNVSIISSHSGAPGLLKDYDYNSSTQTYTARSSTNTRIVYSFHAYAPRDYTHQGVEEGLYEAIGTPYPLPSSALVLQRVYDGTRASGQTAVYEYLPFVSVTNLGPRYMPALLFSINNHVPIFVGEFSAVDLNLVRSDRVPVTSPRRAITGLVVDGSGNATVYLGNLTGGFNINVFPQGATGTAPGATDEAHNGYNGAYSDFAKANITFDNGANAAYNITDMPVRLEFGSSRFTFTYPSGSRPPATTLGSTAINGAATKIATLTLTPRASAAAMDAARVQYVTDVLSMCVDNLQCSWAYWVEDGYTKGPEDVSMSSVFVGWRPSPAVSKLLTKAARRRTVL